MKAAGLLAATLSLSLTAAAAGPARPYQGDGACLSCHGKVLPVLPNRPCLACHAGNMDFAGRESPGSPQGTFLAAAAGAAAPWALLAAKMSFDILRPAPAFRALSQDPPPRPPAPGARFAARDLAADLRPLFAPSGEAVVFGRRGPDTQGDGGVDLRDGQALFLLRREWRRPRRLTPYVLDFAAGEAAWSSDGRYLVLPCPLSDTDGDGRITFADRHGLLLFDGEGREAARLPAGEAGASNPVFSPGGGEVAFAEGEALKVWSWRTGRLRTLAPGGGGLFPRLCGWPAGSLGPAFTLGREYRRLSRDGRGRRTPEGSPLQAGAPPEPLPLAGEAVWRWSRGEVRGGSLYALAESREGSPRFLVRFAGGRSQAVTPPGRPALAYAPAGEGAWVWLGGDGRAVAGWTESGRLSPLGLSAPPALLEVAGTEDFALFAFPHGPRGRALAFAGRGGTSRTLGGPDRAWFHPAAAGSAAAAVLVSTDTDADGSLTPLDVGELWIFWEVP
ncbi:MAG: hypothetical protein ACP5VN_04090 [Acidobacteriota bacterium]